jgi:hypothetical protein
VDNVTGRTYNFNGQQLNQQLFFSRTGYYMKQVDPSNELGWRDENLFVIHINTELGSNNALQNAALYEDLAFVASRGGSVYLLGHRPCQMDRGAESSWIPSQYRYLVRAVVAGHTHLSIGTSSLRYTQVGSISQGGTSANSFWATRISKGGVDIRVQTRTSDEVRYVGGQNVVPRPDHWEPYDSSPSCTLEGRDPYSSGSLVQCCSGLQMCLDNWNGGSSYFYLCLPNCP